MPMNNSDVAVEFGNQRDYDSLANKNPNAVYFTTDTHRIYVGDDEYTNDNKMNTETKAYVDAADNAINGRITELDYRIGELEDKQKTIVYGWHVDPSESDSAAAVTYLADANGKTPARMGANTFDYGSWADAFFMPKPCMLKSDGTVAYYLDPNDYTKKLDGTASDVANASFDGNAMMEWPKLWYKFVGTNTLGEGSFFVSNTKIDDTYHCWCNIDSTNNEIDHFYTAIYNGTGTEKLRSISGVALTSANGSGGTNAAREIAQATANNTTNDIEWYIDVYSDRQLINALLVLIGKSLNTQAVFGRGLDTGGQTAKEAYITGALNDKGLFWGITANGNSGVKVFGMENYWSCCWRRTAGCINDYGTIKVKLTYGTADGSTATGYNPTGNGYISNGTSPGENNWVSKMNFNEYGMIPVSMENGSSSTYYTDYYYQNNSIISYLLAGGTASSGLDSGGFCFSLSRGASHSAWSFSAALSCKPLSSKG